MCMYAGMKVCSMYGCWYEIMYYACKSLYAAAVHAHAHSHAPEQLHDIANSTLADPNEGVSQPLAS